MKKKIFILFFWCTIASTYVAVSQSAQRIQFSSAVELFQFNPYSFFSIGGDANIALGKKWSLNYQIRLSTTGNNNIYFHTGTPQVISYICFNKAFNDKSFGWGLAGLIFAALPEGVGYKIEKNKFKSQLNISMWGFEQYSQSDPNFRFSTMSQTLQYKFFINKPWKSVSQFAPYLAFTINDQVNWKTPALTGWRIGCNFIVQGKNRTQKSKIRENNHPPSPNNPEQNDFD